MDQFGNVVDEKTFKKKKEIIHENPNNKKDD
jgi:hypothetical protein